VLQDVIENRVVTVSGPGAMKSFKMLNNAKAFKIQVSTLYSDKHRCILRELCTNAYDSHIGAGKVDVPFVVHLPTSYAPHFSVRDFGTSMTHDFVMNRYSTVFDSSKDQDNTQVGSFGLGSKTPFAYRDSFTTTCWLAGRKRVYYCFFDSDGIPAIKLMVDVVSNEPQGVEVLIPVENGDADAWAKAAEYITLGFDVKPLWVGHSLVGKVPEPVLTGDGWKIYSALSFSPITNIYGRQGCVAYPIAPRHLIGNFNFPIMVVDFPIGALEVTPSREALVYSDRTNENIRARFLEIKTQITLQLEKEISACTSLREAIMLGERFKLNYPLFSQHQKSTWRGRAISETVALCHILKNYSADAVEFARAEYPSIAQIPLIEVMTASVSTAAKRSFAWTRGKNFLPIVKRGANQTTVFFEDTSTPTSRPAARIRQYITTHKPPAVRDIMWVRGVPSYGIKRLLARAGLTYADVVEVSKLPLPTSSVRVKSPLPKRPAHFAHVMVWDPSRKVFCAPNAVDYSQKGNFYVETSRKQPVLPCRRTISAHHMNQIIDVLRAKGVVSHNARVYGLAEHQIKKAQANGVRSLFLLFENWLDTAFDCSLYAQLKIRTYTSPMDEFLRSAGLVTPPAEALRAVKHETHPFGVWMKSNIAREEDRAILADMQIIAGLATIYNYAKYEHVRNFAPQTDLNVEKVYETYPMLRLFQGSARSAQLSDWTAIANYVNEVDEKLTK
jgi:hypothetical protein